MAEIRALLRAQRIIGGYVVSLVRKVASKGRFLSCPSQEGDRSPCGQDHSCCPFTPGWFLAPDSRCPTGSLPSHSPPILGVARDCLPPWTLCCLSPLGAGCLLMSPHVPSLFLVQRQKQNSPGEGATVYSVIQSQVPLRLLTPIRTCLWGFLMPLHP